MANGINRWKNEYTFDKYRRTWTSTNPAWEINSQLIPYHILPDHQPWGAGTLWEGETMLILQWKVHSRPSLWMPQLLMMEDSPSPSLEEENNVRPEPGSQETMAEISFHAIVGANHPQTMRVSGKRKNKTDNTNKWWQHSQFHWSIFSHQVGHSGGSGQKVSINGGKPREDRMCWVVSSAHHHHPWLSTADYYVLQVEACQLVLGIWIQTRGPIETDYKQLTMTFKGGGISHTF